MIRMTKQLQAALERLAEGVGGEDEFAAVDAVLEAFGRAAKCNCIVSTHRILHEKSCTSLNAAELEAL